MVDWSELLPEIVLEIGKGLTFYEDFIFFSKVCSAWHSATRNCDHSKRLPSRYPSLLVVDDNRPECQIHVMDGTVRTVQLPKPPKSRVFSSTGGWFLIIEADTTTAKLFHPISRRQIELPDMKTLPDVDLDDGYWDERTQVCRVLLSWDPTTKENEQDLIVMVVCGNSGWLAFCRPKDSSWTTVQQGWISRVQDFCYYKGKAYTFDGQGYILSCDLRSENPVMLPVSKRPLIGLVDGLQEVVNDQLLPPSDANCKKLLVVHHNYVHHSYSKEELKMLETVRRFTFDDPTFTMDVYRFFKTEYCWVFECDLETGEWSKVENLGNKAIFVGMSSSFIMEASGCIKPNCIYFTDNIGNPDFIQEMGNIGKLDVGMYDLSDGSIEPHFGESVQSLSERNNPIACSQQTISNSIWSH